MGLLCAVHVLPRFQRLGSQQVVHRLHHRLTRARGKAFITAVTGNILQQGAKNPEQLAGNEEQTNQATY